MSSLRLSRKRRGKVSSDNAAISFDLLSNLTYMAALATGGPDRDTILLWAIGQEFKTGTVFRRVYILSKRLGFEYTRAFRMVSAKAGAKSVKNLLLRFAGAISSGVSEADFLAEEARVERDLYINAYHRSLETLTKWGDAYAALLELVPKTRWRGRYQRGVTLWPRGVRSLHGSRLWANWKPEFC